MADSSPPPHRPLGDPIVRGFGIGCLIQVAWIALPMMLKSHVGVTLVTWVILEWIVLCAILMVEWARGYKKSALGLLITASISGSIVFLLTSTCGTLHVM